MEAIMGRCAAVLAIVMLSLPSASAYAEGQVQIGREDYWYYEGEVEPRPVVSVACYNIPCPQVCDWQYCANGTGRYGTDGGQSYAGEFRHGWMHGHGTYRSDDVSYV